jgi:DNA-binding response OmpR family regulator
MSEIPRARRVLVVDDSVATSRALATLLRGAGYEPVVCHTGGEAWAYATETVTAPAAVVLDVHLPDINGLILSKKLRDRFGPDTPIIVLSGDTSMETLGTLPHVGATYFFSKPVSSGQLIERLNQSVA